MVDRSRELYELARVKMKAGAFAEAVDLFEKSIRVYPHFKALELLGECLVRLDRLTEAIVPLALDRDPSNRLAKRALQTKGDDRAEA